MSVVALLRDASHAGTMMMALKKIGPKNVAIRNHFDRTRSRYSRLITAQSLAMSAHSLFNTGGTDLLQEDLMQRGLDHFEPLHRRARFDDASEQRLRVCARREFDLEEPVGVIGATDQRVIAQDLSDISHSIAVESKSDVALAVLLFHLGYVAIENFLAARDDAD